MQRGWSKINKDKYLFRCTSIPLFGEIILQNSVGPNPRKVQVLMNMPPPKCKMKLIPFWCILNYLSKFSPVTDEMCEPLRKHINKGIMVIELNVPGLLQHCQEVNNKRCMHIILQCFKALYLETDTSGIGHEAALLQVREGMKCRHDIVLDNATLLPTPFASKSPSSTGQWNSNIELEALGILHGLKHFYHWYFAKDVYVIADHKPLATMVNKDVSVLSQWLQCIMPYTHQYSVHIYTNLAWIIGLRLQLVYLI